MRNRITDFGRNIGVKIFDLFYLRSGKEKREIRLTDMLVLIQKPFWKVS